MSWLGIAIFVVFSLGLALFFRWDPERVARRALPEPLSVWRPGPSTADAELEERRWLVVAGGVFGRTRLIEQVRYRDRISGEVLRVLPERVLQSWYW